MTYHYYFYGTPFLFVIIPILIRRWSRHWSGRDKLKGKVVLVTGASSGLGEALSHELYKQGCKVILAARRLDQLERVKSDLMALSCKSETFTPEILKLDLADLDSLPSLAEKALEIHGQIDILINNGGISLRGNTVDTEMSVHQRIMLVNYFGSICLTKALLPSMINRKSGQIVMINSVQGKIGLPQRSAYGASKHALQAYTDTLRSEISNYGVNVLSVCAGYIKTSFSMNALTAQGDQYAKMDDTTAEGYKPDFVAKKIISAMKYDEKEITISPLSPKLAILIRTLLPNLYFYLMQKRAQKMS